MKDEPSRYNRLVSPAKVYISESFDLAYDTTTIERVLHWCTVACCLADAQSLSTTFALLYYWSILALGYDVQETNATSLAQNDTILSLAALQSHHREAVLCRTSIKLLKEVLTCPRGLFILECMDNLVHFL